MLKSIHLQTGRNYLFFDSVLREDVNPVVEDSYKVEFDRGNVIDKSRYKRNNFRVRFMFLDLVLV